MTRQAAWILNTISNTGKVGTDVHTHSHALEGGTYVLSRRGDDLENSVTVVVTWLTRPEAVYNKDARGHGSVISAR